ncbi:hypothetical protein EJB05_01064, partial [Eragrostis curvula]
MFVSGCLFVLLLRSAAAWAGSSGGDELALLSFKTTLSDPAGSLASWNTSNRVCGGSWSGVVCGRRRHPDRVVALRMNSLGLGGRVSPSLGNLSFLRSLDLGNNSLAGRIPPQLGRLRRLQVLNLSVNALDGDVPTALGRCTQLWALGLRSNRLHGGIPDEVCALRNLVYLDLGSNHLSGEIPASVANLSSLQELRLGFNTLSGAIPPGLGELPNLSVFYVYFNNLSGSIPDSLWNISSLTFVSFYGNGLSGTIPTNAFVNVPRLSFLILSSNQFHGQIPSSIANASSLVNFQMAYNYFSGTVPSELGGLKGLWRLALVFNSLEASEPKDWNFMTSLQNCSQLQTLELDSNNFTGELPSSISNLSISLQKLGLSGNQIFGGIPQHIGNLIGLQTLALESNNLNGPLPFSLSMLQSLQYLSLWSNNLWGNIQLIGNLTRLQYLYIGYNSFNGSIPTTMENLKALLEFDLSRNYFTGSIPSYLFDIPTLTHELDLSHNLLEGPLPPAIGNLKSVSFFHAESNMLSGEIPSTIGECQLLQNLYLQNNSLSGSLPQRLSELKNLEFIDLSSNNLSGQIPKFLGTMSALTHLNLSFNNFSGEVPTFGLFSNVSAFSIDGNTKLCGGISELHLPPCSFQLPKKKKVLVTPIVVPIVATIIILLFLYFFLIWNKKRSTESPSTTPIISHPHLSYWQLVKATDDFSTENLLGAGTFGSVYKGKLHEDGDETANLVAIKVLRLQIPGAVKSFIVECDAMKNIRHRNLVKIITACSSIDFKGDDFKAIVFEFMPNGSLEEWLHPDTNSQPGERHLNLTQRVNILFDVAYALDYLHFHGAAPIVHCDLKPSNVLLDTDMVAHVGDFGLARFLAEGCSTFQLATSSMGFRGTIGYAPPEYGAGNIVSTHGDMYSYGILVLEMITGRKPTDHSFEGVLDLRNYVEMALNSNMTDIFNMDLPEDHENNCENRRRLDSQILLLKLGLLCSVETPSSRMTTKEIIKELHVIKNALANKEEGST